MTGCAEVNKPLSGSSNTVYSSVRTLAVDRNLGPDHTLCCSFSCIVFKLQVNILYMGSLMIHHSELYT